MPSGNGPPDPCLPQAVFTALHGYTYDSTNLAFKDTGNTLYWLFAQVKGGTGSHYYDVSWVYGTETEGSTSPQGLINSATSTVILSGTFDTTNDCIDYGGSHYRIRLRRDTSTGQQLAEAYRF